MSAFYVGLDLGQARDFTALAIAEQSYQPDPVHPGEQLRCYAIRHLQRFALGTSYPAIVDAVNAMLSRAPLAPPAPPPNVDFLFRPPVVWPVLAVDATGVGRAVVDLFRNADLPAQLVPVTITAGSQVTALEGSFGVPKKDLIGTITSLLQCQRVVISKGLPDYQVLVKELSTFRVKVSLAGNETFEAWREKDHDDMVFALALSVWAGETVPRPYTAAVAFPWPEKAIAPEVQPYNPDVPGSDRYFETRSGHVVDFGPDDDGSGLGVSSRFIGW